MKEWKMKEFDSKNVQKCEEEEEEVSCFSIAPPPYSINSFVEGL